MGDVTPLRRRKTESATSSEDMLRALFKHEAQLERDVRDCRRKLAAARSEYATKHGLLMLPSLEQLRRIFSQ